ncbi:MAG: uncharacterized protein A8A55_1456 [Amphiamblys sp. WSBS2006]|nr:MAG: uncharacterized protein A8A55_1456 [Amphiamblys sp. WSBS2006]
MKRGGVKAELLLEVMCRMASLEKFNISRAARRLAGDNVLLPVSRKKEMHSVYGFSKKLFVWLLKQTDFSVLQEEIASRIYKLSIKDLFLGEGFVLALKRMVDKHSLREVLVDSCSLSIPDTREEEHGEEKAYPGIYEEYPREAVLRWGKQLKLAAFRNVVFQDTNRILQSAREERRVFFLFRAESVALCFCSIPGFRVDLLETRRFSVGIQSAAECAYLEVSEKAEYERLSVSLSTPCVSFSAILRGVSGRELCLEAVDMQEQLSKIAEPQKSTTVFLSGFEVYSSLGEDARRVFPDVRRLVLRNCGGISDVVCSRLLRLLSLQALFLQGCGVFFTDNTRVVFVQKEELFFDTGRCWQETKEYPLSEGLF